LLDATALLLIHISRSCQIAERGILSRDARPAFCFFHRVPNQFGPAVTRPIQLARTYNDVLISGVQQSFRVAECTRRLLSTFPFGTRGPSGHCRRLVLPFPLPLPRRMKLLSTNSPNNHRTAETLLILTSNISATLGPNTPNKVTPSGAGLRLTRLEYPLTDQWTRDLTWSLFLCCFRA